MAQKSISEETLKTDCGLNSRPIFDPKGLKKAMILLQSF